MSYSTRDITPGGAGSAFPGRHDFDFGPRRSASTRRPSANIDPFERSTSTSRRPSFAGERRGGFSDLPGADFLTSGASGRRGAVVDDSFDRDRRPSRFLDPYASMPSRDIGAGTEYSRYRNDGPPSSYARYESRPSTSSSRSRYSERRGSILDDPFARQASSRYESSRESSRYPPSSFDRYAESSTRRPSTQRFTDQYYSGSSYEMRGHRDDPYARLSRSGSSSGRRSSSSGSRFRFF